MKKAPNRNCLTSVTKNKYQPMKGSILTLLALCCTLFGVNLSLHAQCSIDAGPDLTVTCINPTATPQVTINNVTTPQYAWSGPSGFFSDAQSPALFSGGVYTVTVTDLANGCTATDEVMLVPNQDIPNLDIIVDFPINCFGFESGILRSNLVGSQYSYLWSNGSASSVLSELGAGTYCATVTDASNGCTATACEILNNPIPVSGTATVTPATCFGSNTGAIQVTGSGGTPPYLYFWSNGATGPAVGDLAASQYCVTIFDNLDCQTVICETIQQSPQLVITVNTVTPTTCGNSSGAIEVSVSGGTGGYTYAWSNNQNTEDLSNLSGGSYVLTVSDASGCTATTQVIVANTDGPQIDFNDNPPSCAQGNNGAISLAVSGGQAPYTYLWSTGATGVIITNLSAGTYTVTVTGANSCANIVAITLDNPAPIVLPASLTPVSCFGLSNGAINVNASGGTIPYNYNWAHIPGNNNPEDLNGLTAGFYNLTVTDANGCTRSNTYTITQPLQLFFSVFPTSNCDGSPVRFRFSFNGALPPINYSWTNSSNGTTGNGVINSNLEAVGGFAPGNYTFTMTAATGCTQTASAVMPNVTGPLSVTFNTQPICGSNNGQIQAIAAGGLSPYTFQWSNGSTTAILTPLSAPGNYCVTVTDGFGCSVEDCVNLTTVPAVAAEISIQALPSCFNSNGALEAIATGGSGPFQYNWSNSQSGAVITGIPSGLYRVTISDANNCTASSSINLFNSDGPGLVTMTTNASCFGISSGSIDLTVSGGISPYTYDWSNDGAETPDNDPQDLGNLVAGTYTVTVTAANGCTATTSATVMQPANIASSVFVNNATCGQNNGSFNLLVSGGTAPYTYNWTGPSITPANQNVQSPSNLAPGAYTLTVTDIQGCTHQRNLTINVGGGLTLTAFNGSILCNGGANGSINLSVSGGVPPYNYNWSNGATTQVINNLVAGTYTVTVTDANGCTGTRVAVISQPAPLLATTQVTNSQCGASTGVITLVVIGGAAPYTFLWSNGNNGGTIGNLSAGTYTATITDSNGCTSTANGTVQSGIDIEGVSTSNTCNGTADGSIAVTHNGGTGPFTYNWSNGALTQTNSNLPAGTYTVTVTDATGCSGIRTFTVFQPTPVEVTELLFCDYEAQYTIKGGLSPYIYSLGNTQPGIVAANTPFTLSLQPGVYSLNVTDINGCPAQPITLNVSANEPPCSKIYGRVIFDANENCQPDTGETGFGNLILKASSGGLDYYGMSDTAGDYFIRVKPGAYSVSVQPPSLGTFGLCNSPQTAVIAQPGDSTRRDFLIKDIPDCPNLTVEIASNFLRRCFNNNYYYVQYFNESPFTAENAFVDVTLDPFLNFIGSTRPHTSLGLNVYRFQLGNVPGFSGGTFVIRVEVSCDAALGQAHCTEAVIYPNVSCVPPNPNWSGAFLEVRAQCESDSLKFILKNTGLAPMSSGLEYIVIEDGVMFLNNNAAPLAAQDSMVVSLPANGSTWRIEADQEPLAPGLSLPILSVEGCTNTGSFSTGFLTQFALNQGEPYVDIECRENQGSFDPNDKQGFPLGYGNKHYIRPGQELEYMIRFQNTGTDTAFRVVIRDTLSPLLDRASIRPGVSSHDYKFEISGDGILIFDYQNIMLPDSNVNLEASQGFVKYTIKPLPDAPLETPINNRAAIYFDFNEPVLTNTTEHRQGQNFITVNTWTPERDAYTLSVQPNPAREEVRIAIPDAPSAQTYTLMLYDLQGKLMLREENSRAQFRLNAQSLQPGLYLLRIDADGQLLGSAKTVIER